MRFNLGQKGVGGRNESWYYLVRKEADDDFELVHEWSNMSGLSGTSGEERKPITESAGRSYYSNAVAVIREKFPAWRDIDKL